MTYIVTGAAGFVGSNIVKALNARGITDIVAVDNLTHADKFKNLVDCEIAEYVDKKDFLEVVESGELGGSSGGDIDAIFHQGACSNTMETDGRYMMENNYRYSLSLLDFCVEEGVPLMYASSAAVYGGGTTFKEDRSFEAPLNVYGYSKFLFDQAVRKRIDDASSQIVGFRYFNVYGPRESQKGRMASMAFHFFNQYRATGKVKLFEGSGSFGHGAQSRDFVSVEDVVKVNLFFLDNNNISGIFNLGTGRSQPFNDLAVATVNALREAEGKPASDLAALKRDGVIEYVPFPDALKGKYQSFTQADISLLREAGYADEFLTVEEGVRRYVPWLAAQ